MRRRLFPLVSVLLLAMGSSGLDAGTASAALASVADEGTEVVDATRRIKPAEKAER